MKMSFENKKFNSFKVAKKILEFPVSAINFLANHDRILTRTQKLINEENKPIDNPMYAHFKEPNPLCIMQPNHETPVIHNNPDTE